MFLQGEVAGVPTPMLLDSGANITALSSAFAERLGLGEGWPIDTTGSGGEQASFLHEAIDIEVAGQSLEDQTVVVLDLSGVSESVSREIPVILGKEIFVRMAIDLDYPNHRIALRDPGTVTYDGSGRVMTMHENRGGSWAVDVDVEHRAVGRFEIDTGSTGAIDLYDSFTKEHRLLEGRSPLSTGRGVGIGGPRQETLGTLRSVGLAGIATPDVPAFFGVTPYGPDQSNDGALGAVFLRQFRLRFDPKRKLLTVFVPIERQPLPRDRSGLETRLTGEGLYLDFVRPGSPAARAGWKEGVVLVAIDGTPVDAGYYESPVADWHYAPAGTSVALRDVEGRDRVLVLADYY